MAAASPCHAMMWHDGYGVQKDTKILHPTYRLDFENFWERVAASTTATCNMLSSKHAMMLL
jgi:hypothetical protein